MNFHIITLFPESLKSYISSSILKRAQNKRLIKIRLINPRDFIKRKHKQADDKPYGGGPGMVLKAGPILKAVTKVVGKKGGTKIILLSPNGKQFTNKLAQNWARRYKHIVLISGHYEGIDERVKKILKTEEISIGPYILTGGELPALIIVDAVSRHIPEVLGKKESLEEIKGSYPVYTRPGEIKYKNKKYKVPKILLSGDHKKIEKWRRARSR